MVQSLIAQLVCYGLERGLIECTDGIWCANRLLELFGEDELDEEYERQILEGEAGRARIGEAPGAALEKILAGLCDAAYEKGLIPENTVGYRDLFDTKIMGLLTPAPSVVERKFFDLYRDDPKKATDWYYTFSQDTDYIRRYRIEKDMKWTAETEYGLLDITINLSKPEKDPKAIAAARLAKASSYPKCLLCRENVGYAGRINHPARQNHRILPVNVDGGGWFMQYSPYVYYNEHCIVFNGEHVPMKIDRSAFGKLFDFVSAFPHYFIGSNADLPIVGGSILSHEHFQGGGYEFAMAKAPIEKEVVFKGYENVTAGIVKWPMSVIRISSEDDKVLVDLADKILTFWRGYTDEDAFIYASTDGEPHNTITPIARKRGDKFELDLVLRNNITTEEHPLGVYHPHSELHHIKKENIGLIEVMGLAVLPARLRTEMQDLNAAIREGKDIRADETLEKHADWVDELKVKYPDLAAKSEEELTNVLQKEIGIVFAKVLEHAGVYKRTDEGQAAFMRFVDEVNKAE